MPEDRVLVVSVKGFLGIGVSTVQAIGDSRDVTLTAVRLKKSGALR